jgi:CubicO group peptidase (beta-lactamase class C family)
MMRYFNIEDSLQQATGNALAISVQRKIFSLRVLFIFFFATGFALSPGDPCFGISNSDYFYRIPAKAGDGWETAAIDEVNMDAEKLFGLVRHIRKDNYKNIYSLLLVKDGKLVLEEYFNGRHREELHQIRSATKSIGSMLTGIAIDHQFIKGADEKILPYFKDYETGRKWDGRARDVTLSHLLTMTSGYDCDDHTPPGFLCEKSMYDSNDWVAYALDLPMSYYPGEHWAYNSSSLILVSDMISRTSKMALPDFADKYLFKPLGIDAFHWGGSPKGRVFIAGNAKMKPRDMAKIGLLMLNRGRWHGKQVLSEKWIRESTRTHATSESNWGYGYLWWTGRQSFGKKIVTAYWAAGNGGNYIFVCPALDLVAVFTGGNFNSILEVQPFGMLINHIIPALLPPMPPRQTIELDPTGLDAYIGEYQSARGRIRLSVNKEGENLFGNVFGRTLQLHPEIQDGFFVPDAVFGDWTLRIERGEKNEVTAATGYTAFQRMLLKKIK